VPAVIGLEIAFGIQLVINHQKRKAIQIANAKSAGDLESGASTGLMGSAGLTTIFNALT
jgi:hypothetical protein